MAEDFLGDGQDDDSTPVVSSSKTASKPAPIRKRSPSLEPPVRREKEAKPSLSPPDARTAPNRAQPSYDRDLRVSPMPQAPPPPQRAPANQPSQADDGKMFIGGLSWETTEEKLAAYFSDFGHVASATVMRDPSNGRSRGFGFVVFSDPSGVQRVLDKPYHAIDNKNIDPKRAVPRRDEPSTEKLFVRSVPPGITPAEFRAYFTRYGTVTDSTLMMDRDTGNHRGFGFITYADARGVETALAVGDHILNGQAMDVKKSTPRGGQNNQPARGGGFDGSSIFYADGGDAQQAQDPMAMMAAMQQMMMAQMTGGVAQGGGALNSAFSYDPAAMAQFYAMAQNSANAYGQSSGFGGSGPSPYYQQQVAYSQPRDQDDRGGSRGRARGRGYGSRGGSRSHPYSRD